MSLQGMGGGGLGFRIGVLSVTLLSSLELCLAGVHVDAQARAGRRAETK